MLDVGAPTDRGRDQGSDMNAIDLLIEQHRETDELFDRFEQTEDDDAKQALASEILVSLRMHTTIEEEIFYPAVRERVPDTEDDVLEGYEEHHAVELLLDELEGMSPEDERFTAKTTVVIELVRHHVEEEEDQLFPEVRESMGESVLSELGERMAARAEELLAGGGQDLTKEELYARAQELDIAGRSQMSKRELIRAIGQAEAA